MANKIKPIREIKTVPEKKSIVPMAIGSFVVIVILGILAVSVISKYNATRNSAVKPSATPSPKTIQTTASPSGTATTVAPTNPAELTATVTPGEAIPAVQVIYYGQVGDKMGFYVTNKDMQRYVSRGNTGMNAYQGQVLFEDGSYNMSFDFREMKNTKVVMKTDDILINGLVPAIGNFKRNDATGMLYLVLNTVGNRPNMQVNIAEVVYRVDLYYGRVRKIMTHQLGGNTSQKGPMTIMGIWHDDYLLLKIDNCLNCSVKEPLNWAVVNVNTYAVRYLGIVTDVREDQAHGTYTFRNLVAVKETCGPSDTNCDEFGEKTVYKPSAQINTSKLP